MNFTPRKAEPVITSPIGFPLVSTYMAKDEVTLHPDLSISKAIDVLLTKKVTGVPVMDSQRKIVGMISEKDCLRLLIDSGYNNMPYEDRTVADYMSTDVHTVSVNDDIFEVASKFLANSYRKFPVVDQNGILKGQVSRRDILKAMREIKPTTW